MTTAPTDQENADRLIEYETEHLAYLEFRLRSERGLDARETIRSIRTIRGVITDARLNPHSLAWTAPDDWRPRLPI